LIKLFLPQDENAERAGNQGKKKISSHCRATEWQKKAAHGVGCGNNPGNSTSVHAG
jgi:hypothetical protein